MGLCGREGAGLYTIGCGCNRQPRDFLWETLPPGNVFFLKRIDQLAAGLVRLFSRTLLHPVR